MEKDTTRIEALSDGVFAIAITLLTIEIGVNISNIELHHTLKETTNKELLSELLALWTKIFAYVNSFASVLLMWMSHHHIFKMIRTTNKKLVLVNGLLLMAIALVPFPTNTLGEFLMTGAQNTAIIFYTGYTFLVALTFVIFFETVKSNNGILFLKNITTTEIKIFGNGLWKGFALNTAIFVTAFFLPMTALILNFIMWIFWASIAKSVK